VITGRMWTDMLAVGLVMAAGTLGVMDWALPGGLVTGGEGRGPVEARTLGFTTLVFFQLFNALNARFEDHSAFRRLLANRWLWLALLVSAALQVAVVHAPFLQRAFRTAPLAAGDWLLSVAVASTVLWATELRKLAKRSLTGRRAASRA
jgi:magnesium-transporting ATPase (P-type)